MLHMAQMNPKGQNVVVSQSVARFVVDPSFATSGNLPAKVQDLLSWLRGRGDRPQFPARFEKVGEITH